MSKTMKIARIVYCLCLLLVGILVISQPATVLAQDRTPLKEGEERLHMDAVYPKVEGTAGESFEFEVKLQYLTYLGQGEARVFDLVTTGPKDWYIYMTPRYEQEKKILGVRLEPAATALGETIRLVAIPPFWLEPEPGEYTITLEAISGELKGSLKLTAVITARYALGLVPAEERYNTSATVGKDNYFSLEVLNIGTAAIDNVTFSSSKPEGWTIDFSPDKVDSLAAGNTQTVDVNIKPSPRTIAGDYLVTLRASGKQTSASGIDIRVTVETPSIWGWVGVGIIVVVIGGIIVVFMRFSRR